MSKREVINPEDHGWEFVGNKWIWNAGRNTGHIVDGDTEGQIATWHDPANAWTPTGAIVVSGGNVGIGTDSPTNTLVVSDGSDGLEFRTSLTDDNRILSYNRGTSAYTKISLDAADYAFRINGGSPALTIDATGDATFSGSIYLQDQNARFFWNGTAGQTRLFSNGGLQIRTGGFTEPDTALTIDNEGDATFSGVVSAGVADTSTTAGGVTIGSESNGIVRINTPAGASHEAFQIFRGPNKNIHFSALGNATFSGTVDASVLKTNVMKISSRNIASDHFGLQFGSSLALTPCAADNSNTNGVASLGLSSSRFKDCFLTGSVVSTRHGVSVGTRDLIETLATLRIATQDETTIEGLRDSISNAIGGLIEKFEAMQTASTQEINDE